MVVYGENAFWAAGGFFIAIPRVATSLSGGTVSSAIQYNAYNENAAYVK